MKQHPGFNNQNRRKNKSFCIYVCNSISLRRSV